MVFQLVKEFAFFNHFYQVWSCNFLRWYFFKKFYYCFMALRSQVLPLSAQSWKVDREPTAHLATKGSVWCPSLADSPMASTRSHYWLAWVVNLSQLVNAMRHSPQTSLSFWWASPGSWWWQYPSPFANFFPCLSSFFCPQ